MFEKLFEGSRIMTLPVLSMLLFIAVFCGVLLWVLRGRKREHWERMSRLPLEGSAGDGAREIDEDQR